MLVNQQNPIEIKKGWMWWYVSTIPEFRRLSSEDCEFKACFKG
jgi:hypothetical protein